MSSTLHLAVRFHSIVAVPPMLAACPRPVMKLTCPLSLPTCHHMNEWDASRAGRPNCCLRIYAALPPGKPRVMTAADGWPHRLRHKLNSAAVPRIRVQHTQHLSQGGGGRCQCTWIVAAVRDDAGRSKAVRAQ